MTKRKPALSGRDLDIWRKVTETVNPLGARPAAPPLPPRRMIVPSPAAQGMGAPDLPMEWHTRPGPAPDRVIDRKTKRQIASGRQEVDRSVDLHGMTQLAAYSVLKRTIEGAIRRGDKTLLVVTGKGGKRFSQSDAMPAAYRTRSDFDQLGGVLRRMVPMWLEGAELKPFIQSYGPAAMEHGGDGALYVLLRRRLPGSRKAGAA